MYVLIAFEEKWIEKCLENGKKRTDRQTFCVSVFRWESHSLFFHLLFCIVNSFKNCIKYTILHIINQWHFLRNRKTSSCLFRLQSSYTKLKSFGVWEKKWSPHKPECYCDLFSVCQSSIFISQVGCALSNFGTCVRAVVFGFCRDIPRMLCSCDSYTTYILIKNQ